MRLHIIATLIAVSTLGGCATSIHHSDTTVVEQPTTSHGPETAHSVPVTSPPIEALEKGQGLPASYSIPSRSAIVLLASQLVGARTITSQGKPIAYDCAGVTRAIYLRHGIDLYSDAQSDPKANGVRLIYNHVRRHGILYQGPEVHPGDLVFFDNTWDFNGDGKLNDPLTHVGIVEQLETDGTVIFISRVSGAIERYRMNLDFPHIHKTADGRVLNDYIRRKLPTDPEKTGRLTGELFASFGNRLSP